MAKFYSIPAARALLAQCAALVCVLALIVVLPIVFGSSYVVAYADHFQIPVWVWVLIQSVLAWQFSAWLDMARWWPWIHLLFPLAIWAMTGLHLQNDIYFIGFALSVSLYWSTFKTQVPFFPSRPVVWRQVAKLIPKNKVVRLIDIGSGLGDMPMHIAKYRPKCIVEGVEIAPLPWLISVLRAKIKRSPVQFKLGDYKRLNFAHYDVIFAYLSPAVMLTLWDKAQLEMRPGSLLISLEFDIPGIRPSFSFNTNARTPTLFAWKIK